MSELYPRFEADKEAENASADAWREQYGIDDSAEAPIASTEPVVKAEFPHTAADEQFNKQMASHDIAVSDENTGPQAVEVVVGTPNGIPADAGELPVPAPVDEEPKTPVGV